MPFRFLLCLATIWLACSPAFAVTVAFLEFHREDGSVVQLEPGGRFGHVAIKMGRKWLHAHSEAGVALVHNIERYGDRVVYLENVRYRAPSLWQVQHWLGKPFDWAYRWGVPGSTYCTRLVAEMLQIPPRPMGFSSEVWQKMGEKPVGQMGLSPDELYEDLLKRGFKPVSKCEEVLNSG